MRRDVIYTLLQHILTETDGLAFWESVCQLCSIAVNAIGSELYLYDRQHRRLRRVEPSADTAEHDALDGALDVEATGDHIAVRAIRENAIVSAPLSNQVIELAAPIHGQLAQETDPLAVVALRLPAHSDQESVPFLAELLEQIRPICAYAALRQQTPLLTKRTNREKHTLALDDVLASILETVCDKFGFTVATISLVDDDEQEIRTVAASPSVPWEWVESAHHPLDSPDIQAYILRTGRAEIIAEWVDRADGTFDKKLWDRFNHAELVRAFVPIDDIGTIEAGFWKRERASIPEFLFDLLKRYARDIAGALRNALAYERQRRHGEQLDKLMECNYTWQTDPRQHDEAALLRQIAAQAHAVAVLQARGSRHLPPGPAERWHPASPLVMLYRIGERQGLGQTTAHFAPPLSVGEIEGDEKHLRLPDESDNIVRRIAGDGLPYYQSDAQGDPLLNGTARDIPPPGGQTFTMRQKIRSFAGVPLLVHGEVVGVLCINYRERHQFSHDEQHIIELFAQQAAAALTSVRLVRAQELEQFMENLHDSVKTRVRALTFLHEGIANVLPTDLDRARQRLALAQSTAWVILSDLNLILANLVSDSDEGLPLSQLLREELDRMLSQDRGKIVWELDDHGLTLSARRGRSLAFLLCEAIMNALQHGQAQRVRVSGGRVGRQLCLAVDDNGRGFDPEAPVTKVHRGMAIMRTRAEDLGAELEVTSRPGEGTTVRITMRLPEGSGGAN